MGNLNNSATVDSLEDDSPLKRKKVKRVCRLYHMDKGLVSKETAVLGWWGGETNVWFVNRVDN